MLYGATASIFVVGLVVLGHTICLDNPTVIQQSDVGEFACDERNDVVLLQQHVTLESNMHVPYQAGAFGKQHVINAGAIASPLRELAALPKSDPIATRLTFIHIPKTGGSSVDSVNMHLPRNQRVWKSIMADWYDAIVEGNSQYAEYADDVGTLYEETHTNYSTYGKFIRDVGYYPSALMPDGKSCPKVHTPPNHPDLVANNYYDDGSTVFCSVRDPLDRFISAYQMISGGSCSPEGFENATREILEELKVSPYTNMCFYVPQVELVYGSPSWPVTKAPYCKRIIHAEKLSAEFSALMADFGFNLTLGDERLMSWTPCLVNKANISRATKDMIFNFFKADYDILGYPRPT